MQRIRGSLSLLIVLAALIACGTEPEELNDDPVAAKNAARWDSREPGESSESVDDRMGSRGSEASDDHLDDLFLKQAIQPWTGDLDGMVERRVIRALVAFNRTNYYLDGADQKGISYEALKQFEGQVNRNLKNRHFKVRVLCLPVPRDRMIPHLLEGRGDIAVGNLTITPERLRQVQFSNPFYTGVNEVVVSHSSVEGLNRLEDLAGREVYVRASSSYHESLLQLNRSLKKAGKQEVVLIKADENLETDDILEMVNAGLIKITVADDHLADFWEQMFGNISVRRSLVLRSGGSIGWAFRKGSPLLQKSVNAFVKENKKGTLIGNMLVNRYLRDPRQIENSLSPDKIDELAKIADLFKKYGEDYDFEWLLLAAQGYQESRLNQNLRSKKGAIGVMQILPSTASDPNVDIGQIEKLENNIHAGAKYLRFLVDRYFNSSNLSDEVRHLLALAAYNAGPRRIVVARKRAGEMRLDPNRWFQNVEVMVAKRVGRQPVDYVSNIYKYYISYRLLLGQSEAKSRILEGLETGS